MRISDWSSDVCSSDLNTVGGAWRWWYRRQMSDAELAGILADDRVEVFVLHVDGTPAGYFELDRRDQPGGTGGTIDLAYFGLMAHCVGRGLGRYLLHAAIEQAWSYAPERLPGNTNTLDHPRALPLYQTLGFTPSRPEEQANPGPENRKSRSAAKRRLVQVDHGGPPININKKTT